MILGKLQGEEDGRKVWIGFDRREGTGKVLPSVPNPSLVRGAPAAPPARPERVNSRETHVFVPLAGRDAVE